jgi:hypothetical protein
MRRARRDGVARPPMKVDRMNHRMGTLDLPLGATKGDDRLAAELDTIVQEGFEEFDHCVVEALPRVRSSHQHRAVRRRDRLRGFHQPHPHRRRTAGWHPRE